MQAQNHPADRQAALVTTPSIIVQSLRARGQFLLGPLAFPAAPARRCRGRRNGRVRSSSRSSGREALAPVHDIDRVRRQRGDPAPGRIVTFASVTRAASLRRRQRLCREIGLDQLDFRALAEDRQHQARELRRRCRGRSGFARHQRNQRPQVCRDRSMCRRHRSGSVSRQATQIDAV